MVVELTADTARIGRIAGLQILLAGLHQFGALLKVLHGKPLVLFHASERSDIREMHGAAPLMNRGLSLFGVGEWVGGVVLVG